MSLSLSKVVPRSENFHKSLFTIHFKIYVTSNLLGNIDTTTNQPTDDGHEVLNEHLLGEATGARQWA